MSELAIITAVCGATATILYCAMNVKLEEVPKGRIAERTILYFTGLFFSVVLLGLAMAISANVAALSYLEGFLTNIFLIHIAVIIAVVIFYLVYLVLQILQPLRGGGGDDK